MVDFLVINPQTDTPINIIMAFFLLGLAIWANMHNGTWKKRINEDDK